MMSWKFYVRMLFGVVITLAGIAKFGVPDMAVKFSAFYPVIWSPVDPLGLGADNLRYLIGGSETAGGLAVLFWGPDVGLGRLATFLLGCVVLPAAAYTHMAMADGEAAPAAVLALIANLLLWVPAPSRKVESKSA